jgi:hypothetical protein
MGFVEYVAYICAMGCIKLAIFFKECSDFFVECGDYLYDKYNPQK